MCSRIEQNDSMKDARNSITKRSPFRSAHRSITNQNLGVNVDQLLECPVGSCGLWQWSLTLLISLSCASIATFPVFANCASPHRCRLEPHVERFVQANNVTFHEVAERIGPWHQIGDGAKKSGCYRYKLNWTEVNLTRFFFDRNETYGDPQMDLETCTLGYVYETSTKHYTNNVVAEFATVCDRAWLVPLGTAIYMLGMLFGFTLGGWSGDRFGRRKTILACSLLDLGCGILTCIAPNYTTYVIARGLMAIGNTGKGSVANVFILESTVARHRAVLTTLPGFTTHFLFRALMALYAYLIPNWRWLYFVVWSPNLLSLGFVWFLPESPRWLVSQGRLDEAVCVLKQAYRMNNQLCRAKQDHDEAYAQLDQLKFDPPCLISSANQRCSAFRPLTERNYRKTTCLCIVMVFGVCMSFFGLLFYARVVWNYVYLVSLFNSMTAIPALILFSLVYRYFTHRKKPLMVCMGLSVLVLLICSIYTIVVQPATDIVLTICSNFALVLINATLSMCFVYVPELYPSEMRTHGAGLVMGLSRVGGILCSFVNELDRQIAHGVPLAVYAAVLILVLLALCLLDDTTGENLPDVSARHSELAVELQPETEYKHSRGHSVTHA